VHRGERVDASRLRHLPERELHGQHGHSEEDDREGVRDEEGEPAVFVHHVGEPE
jgi:hypothetical protein